MPEVIVTRGAEDDGLVSLWKAGARLRLLSRSDLEVKAIANPAGPLAKMFRAEAATGAQLVPDHLWTGEKGDAICNLKVVEAEYLGIPIPAPFGSRACRVAVEAVEGPAEPQGGAVPGGGPEGPSVGEGPVAGPAVAPGATPGAIKLLGIAKALGSGAKQEGEKN